MKTLQDALDWFKSTKVNLSRMNRLGIRHWNDDSLKNASIWSDDRFKQVEAVDISEETLRALRPLEDLGILVLFSVFEATVRAHLEGILDPLIDGLNHPVLRHAADQAVDGIRQGSFANNVLSPLQEQHLISAELSSKVKQVRDYRNWVAHGKREPRPLTVVNLTVDEAFTRLTEFLDTLGIVVETELQSVSFDSA